MLADLDLNSIADDRARELVRQLLHLLEDVMADLRVAHAENQRLRDEINRLKGEQGRPTIKSNQPQPPSTDHSSEHERRKPKGWSKGRKMDRISIDREQVVQVDPDCLPPDAQYKGYEDVVVQDVVFRTDHVLFHTEKFYSPFSVEHIIPLAKGGTHDLENLAWSCQGCNSRKYITVEALDPVTGQTVSLYHPRRDRWLEHFAWNEDDTLIIGLTPTGRATVEKLQFNRLGVVNLRRVLSLMDLHPPEG